MIVARGCRCNVCRRGRGKCIRVGRMQQSSLKVWHMTMPKTTPTFIQRSYYGVALAFLAAGLLACRSAEPTLNPPPTVAQVDVDRYIGTWVQQGLIPNRFQKMCAANTKATYARDGAGLSVLNQCLDADGKPVEAQGVAKIVEGSGNAKLRVSFFRPFYGDYWVLALDPDYQWVLVGDPTREYGWVLSRAAQLNDATYNGILDKAVTLGYDKTRFVRSINN
jgi:apolipoprotein D and lipocalin family protein